MATLFAQVIMPGKFIYLLKNEWKLTSCFIRKIWKLRSAKMFCNQNQHTIYYII